MPVNVLHRSFINYLQEFFQDSKSIGILLFVSTILSLVLANSIFGEAYVAFYSAEIPIGGHSLPHSFLHWINDFLMAIFFFLVGMEIKRELLLGELSTIRKAILPIGAAIGGMVLPAILFMLFTKGTPFKEGWGIPMATDIAFALGVAALLGSKFPIGLKVFLTALAIIDDLGAILVIAMFYGGSIAWLWLLGSAALMGLLWFINQKFKTFNAISIILGLALWFCVFNSGIHASIAGVLFAFMVPKNLLQELEHKIHNSVNFIILPLFALANTAIVLQASMLSQISSNLSLAIIFGLFLGKPIGIFFSSWFLVKTRLAKMPAGTNYGHLALAGIVAGIGFTMSIFISTLAFVNKDWQDISKIAILLAMVLSILGSIIWLIFMVKKPEDKKVDNEQLDLVL